MIRYEDFERERLDLIYDTVAPYSEMKKNERYFLNGIIRNLKPKKILEVGVANGGGTAIILNAIRDINGAELYSVDYTETSYRYPKKPSGFLVEEKFPELMDKWHIFRGGDVSKFVEEIGGDIDLLMLDTVHAHPWETLNFLCVLPFMKQNLSWTVLHDISVFAYGRSIISAFACRYLFTDVVSDKKISPVSDYGDNPANIGAFKISQITMSYVNNLFESLIIPWECEVPAKDYEDMKKIIERYYTPKQYEAFCDAFKFQQYLTEHRTMLKPGFWYALKTFAKTWQPGLFNTLRRLKHFLRGNRS